MPILSMDDIDLFGKKVLIREDYNVPLKNGMITSHTRINASLPTIHKALNAGANVMIVSHLGRPAEGKYDDNCSLAPVAQYLSQLLGMEVPLINDWLDGFDSSARVVLLENVRFIVGETTNDVNIAQKIAALCDVFVMDAFATAHRMEASVHGAIKYAPIACAGELLLAEMHSLNKIIVNTQTPLLAIVGGAKISTKLAMLEYLIEKVDLLLVGGGIANTFLACQGYPIGRSLYEKDLLDEAERLMLAAQARGVVMPIPLDVLVTKECNGTRENYVQLRSSVARDEKIVDLGPDSIKQWRQLINKAQTIIWNGPVGAFEIEDFAWGTKEIAQTLANSNAFIAAGGGDTLSAIESYQIGDKINYISTGGGAFLAFFEGKTLPGIAALEHRYLK